MMLTMTPITMIAARTDSSGRAASGTVAGGIVGRGIVGGGIRVVFLGDSSNVGADPVSARISKNRDYQTQEDAGRNNKSQTFYRYDATATYAKPRHGTVHRLQGDGRCGCVLYGQR